MKVYVDEKPQACYSCLFCGQIYEPSCAVYQNGDKVPGKYASGCTLLKMQIPMQIGFSTTLGNCPLTTKG